MLISSHMYLEDQDLNAVYGTNSMPEFENSVDPPWAFTKIANQTAPRHNESLRNRVIKVWILRLHLKLFLLIPAQ